MSLPTPPTPLSGSSPRQRSSSARNGSAIDRNTRPDNTRTLTIHSGVTMRGTLDNVERLIIEGTVEVEHLSIKEIIITQEGTFRGRIEAGTADIYGTLEGEITVRNTLWIRASGRLLGDAECRRLQVDEGGQVTGKLGMITTPLPGSKDAAFHDVTTPENRTGTRPAHN